MASESQTTTDHDEIRKWVESNILQARSPLTLSRA
jgi:hypothetical protein